MLDFVAGPKLVYPMTCAEVLEVLELFSMSDDKKKALRKLTPYVKDPQNKLAIVVSFSFSDDQEEAEVTTAES